MCNNLALGSNNLVIGGSLLAWPELFCCIKMVGLMVVVVVFLFPLVRLLLIVFYKVGVQEMRAHIECATLGIGHLSVQHCCISTFFMDIEPNLQWLFECATVQQCNSPKDRFGALGL